LGLDKATESKKRQGGTAKSVRGQRQRTLKRKTTAAGTSALPLLRKLENAPSA
jgi:hypothetical protein